MLSVGLRPRGSLVASAMKNSGDLHLAIMPVVDDVILDTDGAHAGSELWTEASHPGLFRQEVEAVDEIVDEPVSGSRARVLGDVQPNLVEVLFGARREPIRHLRTSSYGLLDPAT